MGILGVSWGFLWPLEAFWGFLELPGGFLGSPGASWVSLGRPGASLGLSGAYRASGFSGTSLWGLLGPPGVSSVVGPLGVCSGLQAPLVSRVVCAC